MLFFPSLPLGLFPAALPVWRREEGGDRCVGLVVAMLAAAVVVVVVVVVVSASCGSRGSGG